MLSVCRLCREFKQTQLKAQYMDLITKTAELEQALQKFAHAPYMTVDTEFHRQSTYYPELCLIQIACPGAQALIDPLAKGLDLAPFFALMEKPDLVKVFHAARQDVEIFYLLSGKIPAPLFDTQLAASVCGYGDSVSYDSLVQKITGTQLDKSSRFTDWKQRPLSEKQLRYAIADVTYLRDIYEALAARLEQTGRAAWLKEEMAVLNAPETYKLPPEQAWKKVKSSHKLRKPAQWAALQRLAAWREETAQNRNLPRGHVLADESLLEIALQLPRDKAALTSMRALRGKSRLPLDAEAILNALDEAKTADKTEPPQFVAYHSAREQNKAEAEILKLLLKIISDQHNVAARIIATAEDIACIAAEGVKADVPAMRGWRYELFGRPALNMLAGRLAVKFANGAPELFAPPEMPQ